MKQHTLLSIALGLAAVGCAGSQRDANEPDEARAAQVRETERAGNMVVVSEGNADAMEADHEPVIIADADPSEEPSIVKGKGTQGDEDCAPLAVYFDKGSYQLDDVAKGTLARLSDCLETHDEVTIEIVGHADPGHSNSPDAVLVTQRMVRVEEYLQDLGIDQDRYVIRYGHDAELDEEP